MGILTESAMAGPYTTEQVAELCDSKPRTVLLWAKKNDVGFVGTGRHKIYQYTDNDIKQFKQRPKPGRKPH